MGVVGELQVHFSVAPFDVDLVGVACDGWVRYHLYFYFDGFNG